MILCLLPSPSLVFLIFSAWASWQIRKIRGCSCTGNAGNIFPPPRLSDPDMHHGKCMPHVPWCMLGSLTNGFLWSRCRGKRYRHSRRMRNPQFYASAKKPIVFNYKNCSWPPKKSKAMDGLHKPEFTDNRKYEAGHNSHLLTFPNDISHEMIFLHRCNVNQTATPLDTTQLRLFPSQMCDSHNLIFAFSRHCKIIAEMTLIFDTSRRAQNHRLFAGDVIMWIL